MMKFPQPPVASLVFCRVRRPLAHRLHPGLGALTKQPDKILQRTAFNLPGNDSQHSLGGCVYKTDHIGRIRHQDAIGHSFQDGTLAAGFHLLSPQGHAQTFCLVTNQLV